MRKVEWGHKHWFYAIIVIILLVLVVGTPTTFLLNHLGIIDLDRTVSIGELPRTFILISGAFVGLYGLRLAIERQEKFSNQVQVQADQRFNEKLGRGVELLAKEDASTRSAGIRVLEDLANNATDEQKTIIANIIYDFFHEKTRIRYDKNGKRLSSALAKERRQDVQTALDYLTGLPLDERDKLLPSRLINAGRLGSQIVDGRLVNGLLEFGNLDFSFLAFNSKIIERINFSESYFYGTTFGMKYNNISKRRIWSTLSPENTIRYCNFTFAEIKGTIFYETVIELSHFYKVDIDFETVIFHRVEFLEKTFSLKGDVKIPLAPLGSSPEPFSSKPVLPRFIYMDLGETNLNFDGDFDPFDFFHACYYPKGQRPSSKMDASREYEESGDGIKVFVLPEEDSERKDWSGQRVKQWVAVEVAEWRLARGKEIGEDTTELESDFAKATEVFRNVERHFEKPKPESESKPKPKAKKPKPKPPTP